MTAWRRFWTSFEGLTGGTLLLLLAVAALLAPLVYPGDPQAIVAQPLVPPLADPHWPLGTDRLGRDVAAELIH
ncbi:ABC transporter permease, partial [Mycobacterium tuberculosis]|nr:ABC transporter permease [Mycobacterium tuberculosis]